MSLKLTKSFLWSIILIFTWQMMTIKGSIFVFLVEEERIFTDCQDEPNYLGVADVMDLSDLKVELLDESVHMEGNVKMVWKADPNDRIEVQTELLKYARGGWQPTVFTMIEKDFCRTLFDEQGFWFQSWSQFIDPEERKCINNYGQIYHHAPFDLKTVANISGEDISGRHKLVIKLDAFNDVDEKQPYSACVEVPGDIIKM